MRQRWAPETPLRQSVAGAISQGRESNALRCRADEIEHSFRRINLHTALEQVASVTYVTVSPALAPSLLRPDASLNRPRKGITMFDLQMVFRLITFSAIVCSWAPHGVAAPVTYQLELAVGYIDLRPVPYCDMPLPTVGTLGCNIKSGDRYIATFETDPSTWTTLDGAFYPSNFRHVPFSHFYLKIGTIIWDSDAADWYYGPEKFFTYSILGDQLDSLIGGPGGTALRPNNTNRETGQPWFGGGSGSFRVLDSSSVFPTPVPTNYCEVANEECPWQAIGGTQRTSLVAEPSDTALFGLALLALYINHQRRRHQQPIAAKGSERGRVA